MAQCAVLVDQLPPNVHVDDFVHSLLLLIEMISGDGEPAVAHLVAPLVHRPFSCTALLRRVAGKLLVQQADDVIDLFLPAVIALLDSPSGEMRFTAIKCVHSIASTLLMAPTVYSVHNLTIVSTERLHHLCTGNPFLSSPPSLFRSFPRCCLRCTEFLIPRMADLLLDNDPIPVRGSAAHLMALNNLNNLHNNSLYNLCNVQPSYLHTLYNRCD